MRTLEKDERGEFFLVMDVAEGESLRTWMRRKWKSGGVPFGEAVGVLRQVVAAWATRIRRKSCTGRAAAGDGEAEGRAGWELRGVCGGAGRRKRAEERLQQNTYAVGGGVGVGVGVVGNETGDSSGGFAHQEMVVVETAGDRLRPQGAGSRTLGSCTAGYR